jgi:hypothetical protein
MSEISNVEAAKKMMKKLKDDLASGQFSMTDYEKYMVRAREQFMVFLSRYWPQLLGGFVVIFSLLFYFFAIYRRVPRCLGRLDKISKDLQIHPIQSCPKIMEYSYKLCDFYIASSGKSFLPCNQYYDYSSIDMIEKALKMGARCIELDIYNKTFCDDTIPVVCSGKETGNWHWTTDLTFEECCIKISDSAFSAVIPNYTDPLFLALNFHINGNVRTAKKIADIMSSTFGSRMLHIGNYRFSYQRANIGLEPIQTFMNKITIISNESWPTEPKLNEMIHCTWKQAFIRSYTDLEINDLHEPEELQNYNKQHLTRVVSSCVKREMYNYNPRPAWIYGCQFVSMFYNVPDSKLKVYLKKFQKASFVVKPYQLRYKPTVFQKPAPQTNKVNPRAKSYTMPGLQFSI